MNPYALLPLTGFVVNVLLAVAVLSRNPRGRANRIYALFTVALAYWCGLKFSLRLATDRDAALLLYQLSAVGWAMVPAYVLHFVAELTGAIQQRRWRITCGVFYALSLLVTITAPIPGALVREMRLETFGYVHEPGPTYRIFAVVFVASFAVALTLLVVAIRTAAAESERARYQYVAVGLLVPGLGALVTNMLLPMIGIHVVELGEILSTFNAAMVAIAMLRHGLLEISLADASETLLRTMGEALLVVEPGGKVVRANAAAAELFGLGQPELRGREVMTLVRAPEIADMLAGRGDAALKRETEAIVRDGTEVPVLLSARVLRERRTDAVRAVVCVLRDIRDLRSLIAKLEEQLQTDSLTGAASRRHAEKQLVQELARAQRYDRPISVAIVDLDDFKKVNDELGHAAGDVVLRRAAQRMRESMRETDVVARWGGDEFLLLLPESDAAAAQAVCDRILARLGEPAPEGAVRASIGIATVGAADPKPDVDELIRAADEALYAVKRAGKGRAHGVAAPPGEAPRK